MALYRVTTDELYHHGILGQKWGIRRYQNPDGTLTPAGRARYAKEYTKQLNSLDTTKAVSIAKAAGVNRAKQKLIDKYDAVADKGKIEKGQKYLNKIDALNKELSELHKITQDSISKTNELLDKLESEGYSYKTYTTTRYQYLNKENDNVEKTLKTAGVKHPYIVDGRGYYQSAYSTGYKVKPSEKVSKKQAYTKSRDRKEKVTVPIHSTYYRY